MNRGHSDNVYSSIFTPQEYQVELIDACLNGNTMAVLAPKSTRSFLTTMVTRELAYLTRGKSHMQSLILGQSSYKLMRAGEAIQQNSNLAVATYTTPDQVDGWTDCNWENVFNDVKVVVMTTDVITGRVNHIPFGSLNLIIITDAHKLVGSPVIREVLSKVSSTTRILGLTSSVLNHFETPAYLESFLLHLEERTKCIVNTASDVATILRYIHKPQERLIMCSNPSNTSSSDVETEVRRLITEALFFMDDHRYDPVETYGVEYAEFCIGVPDPKKEPRTLIMDFINILDNFGLWCADRAALYTLVEIEKLKKKTAYDRHYLLLCLVFSVMAKIRAVIEEHFEEYTELEQITNFSTPKILRLIEILREVRPRNFVDPRKRRDRIPFKSTEKSKEEKQHCTLCLCTSRASPNASINGGKDSDVSNIMAIAMVSKADIELDSKQNDIPIYDESLNSEDNARSVSERIAEKNFNNLTVEKKANFESTGSEEILLNGNHLDAMIIDDNDITHLNDKKGLISVPEINAEAQLDIQKNTNLTKADDIMDTLDKNNILDSSSLPVSSKDDCEKRLDNEPTLDELAKTCNGVVESLTKSTSSCLCMCHGSPNVIDSKNKTNLPDISSESANMLQLPNRNVAESDPQNIEFFTPMNEPKENRVVDDDDEYMSCEEMDNDVLQIDLTDGEKISLISMIDSEKSFLINDMDVEKLDQKDDSVIVEDNKSVLGDINKCSSSSGVSDDCRSELNQASPSSKEKILKVDETIKVSSSVQGVVNDAVSKETVAISNPPIPGASTLGYFHTSRSRRRREEVKEKMKVHIPDDPDSVCGLIFVNSKATARIVYRLLKELSDIGGDFSWIFPQYTVELKNESQDTSPNANMDARAIQAEHKKQEEVLRRFRHHECNLLVSTSVLEFGIDIPHCNLVLRFDPPVSYSSYVHCRGRAKGPETFYYHLITEQQKLGVIRNMATFLAFEKVLLRFCDKMEKGTETEVCPEEANSVLQPYVTDTGASVEMGTAIALLNKYCAKLPSDTFTRLTVMWSIEIEGFKHRCVVMLPINSPLKGYIKGPWLSNQSLAKMATALICCKKLHKIGELDDNLLPISKESLQLTVHFCTPPPDDNVAEGMPRPGTTKRRQYYFKRVADCLVKLEPTIDFPLWVYKFDMFLSCPIPEEQNTRGRKIYRPETTVQSLGLITSKPIPHISSFPVFTRSGEVRHELIEIQSEVKITLRQLELIQNFHQFTFTQVLRLEKYPIKFHPNNSGTTFYIAPLTRDNWDTDIIDWDFAQTIETFGNLKQHLEPYAKEQKKEHFEFDYKLYQDAVVMPWYRNQDQPQYFYVAEICSHLTPQSDFPDAGFETFEKYYLSKYDIQIKNLKQPLLDVDHTSGRLNLLTPRHVNRKGVALPTTSEETKRAKRENLQQKQILVPELCTLHPFPSSLWRKAVCLPTILYRINGLLLGNQLRLDVAREVGLGMLTLPKDHTWPSLDFGWCLADVLSRTQEATKEEKEAEKDFSKPKKKIEKKAEICSSSREDRRKSELEIGTWSNDMAYSEMEAGEDALDDFDAFDPAEIELPDNLTMLDSNFTGAYESNDDEGELGADWGTGLTERRLRKKDVATKNNSTVRVGSPSNFEVESWDMFRAGTGTSEFPKTEPKGYDSFDEDDCDDDFDNYDTDEGDDYECKQSNEETLEYNDVQMCINSTKPEENLSDEEDDFEWEPENREKFILTKCETEMFISEQIEELCKSDIFIPLEQEIKIIKKLIKPSITDEENLDSTKDMNIDQSIKDKSAESTINSIATESHLNNIADSSLKQLNNETSPLAKEKNFMKPENNECNLCTKEKCEVNLIQKIGNLQISTNEQEYSAPAKEVSIFKGLPELTFSFDYQPDLRTHPGPSPSIILQALTMSNANDGINLERLETIGDSYLKYAITTYLYCSYPHRHEGKLSYLRSKQVSNLNLYRLGKRKDLGECMVATKFEPHDNWLPPGYYVPVELEEALIDSGVPSGHWNMADFPGLHDLGSEQIRQLVQERSEQIKQSKAEELAKELLVNPNPQDIPIFIPYDLLTQHSIPDKSIADCVEALIGAYLTQCGPRGALLFMSWFGIRVMPNIEDAHLEECDKSIPLVAYHQLKPPDSPLAACPIEGAMEELELLLSGYDEFEDKIGYKFNDRSYLLQAFTHASFHKNRLTDCYQRLEFLGDAVLDYLITRHLFEDKRMHSPGALTDLRSALVNNTIFASLAVKFEFHKYFRHFSPGLDRVVRDFVGMQEENGHKINEEYYLIEEEECGSAEDIEVPKALGDVFESIAGAIFMDSKGSLDAVWRVYYAMMKIEIDQFSGVVPKSPIRELLEMEPETAKFGKPERLVDGKVRVSVEVFGKGSFSGIGRNYRIAKSTAAKRALRHLRKLQMLAIPSEDANKFNYY